MILHLYACTISGLPNLKLHCVLSWKTPGSTRRTRSSTSCKRDKLYHKMHLTCITHAYICAWGRRGHEGEGLDPHSNNRSTKHSHYIHPAPVPASCPTAVSRQLTHAHLCPIIHTLQTFQCINLQSLISL